MCPDPGTSGGCKSNSPNPAPNAATSARGAAGHGVIPTELVTETRGASRAAPELERLFPAWQQRDQPASAQFHVPPASGTLLAHFGHASGTPGSVTEAPTSSTAAPEPPAPSTPGHPRALLGHPPTPLPGTPGPPPAPPGPGHGAGRPLPERSRAWGKNLHIFQSPVIGSGVQKEGGVLSISFLLMETTGKKIKKIHLSPFWGPQQPK